MHCPSCEHRLEIAVALCDSCGFQLGQLDLRYGNQDFRLEQITDTTNFLHDSDKLAIQEVIDEFESQFPQFYPAFFLGQLPANTKLSEFAGWLLNRGRIHVLGELRNSENAFLFVIDLTSRSMTVSVGYFAEHYASENDLRELLSDAVPFLTAGDVREALEKLIDDLRLLLKRNHRLLLKHFKSNEDRAPGEAKSEVAKAANSGQAVMTNKAQ